MSGSRNFLRLAIVAVGLMGLIATKSVSAQLATTQSTITLSSSESAWVNLQMLSGPVVLNGNAAPTDPVAALTMQADQFWQASVLAGQFLSVYPGDSLTSDAKKAQVTLALQSVQLGDAQHSSAALALSNLFLANTQNAVADRFDVAVVTAVATKALAGPPASDDATAITALADSLHSQFGNISQVYSLYDGIFRTASAADSAELANKVIGMNAPAWAKADAQIVLTRTALIGTPFPEAFSTLDNQVLALGQASLHPTLVYVWSNRTGTDDLAALAKFKSAIPQNYRVVYVSLQSNLSTAQACEAAAPLPGLFTFETPGFDGLTAHTLGILSTPYVYILDKQGNVACFGSIGRLPALIAAVGD